jgi:hypothetical protein
LVTAMALPDPTPHIEDLFAEVDRDPTAIF